MGKYELKTKVNNTNVTDFLNKIENEKRKEECFEILDLMSNASGQEPKMWGTSIVGFGKYSYKSKSGIEGEWFLAGFSPRKQNLTLYIVPHIKEQAELMKKIGKVKTGKSCIYVNNLEDIDLKIVEKLVKLAMKAKI